MKKILLPSVALLSLSLAASAVELVPKGWAKAGTAPRDFEATLSVDAAGKGPAAAYLTSTTAAPGRFGTLMQTIDARRYAGKRVRLSGELSARGVQSWGGLWLRVDGIADKVLAFDNMQERPVKGDAAWTRASIVLDVPVSAERLAFGFLLDGSGSLGARRLALETVSLDVPVTKPGVQARVVPDKPVNLDFSQR